MRKIYLIITVILLTLQSCAQEYPKELRTGVFKTITELNTVKYMYRNNDYLFIYSDAHPKGNKLSKITWQDLGYKLVTINKTTDYDKLINTIVLDSIIDKNTFVETTYIQGFDLTFTTEWTKIGNSPDEKLKEILKENGIE